MANCKPAAQIQDHARVYANAMPRVARGIATDAFNLSTRADERACADSRDQAALAWIRIMLPDGSRTAQSRTP